MDNKDFKIVINIRYFVLVKYVNMNIHINYYYSCDCFYFILSNKALPGVTVLEFLRVSFLFHRWRNCVPKQTSWWFPILQMQLRSSRWKRSWSPTGNASVPWPLTDMQSWKLLMGQKLHIFYYFFQGVPKQKRVERPLN